MKKLRLYDIAHARSGDKGSSANIGVIAFTAEGYQVITEQLTEKKVADYFHALGVTKVDRYLLPNLWACNFVLHNALAGGASRSLRSDAQGKALGQALLEMEIDIGGHSLEQLRRP
jgi:hypothetical protein